MSFDPWIWIGAFLTLCIFSFLYRDNPLYKFAEHLFVGVSAAYWMVLGFWKQLVPNLVARVYPPAVAKILPTEATKPADLYYLIPGLFGIFLVMRLLPKVGWISRWSLAFVVGATAGFNLIGFLKSDFIGQINSSIIPLVVMDNGAFSFGATLANLVIFLGVFCGLVYFFFSKEHKGAFGTASKIGIFILMITFGAGFGYTVMARISLLLGRMQFLFGDWLGIMR